VQASGKGVKYRAAKNTLSLKQTVRLYAMTVALLTKDPKWPQWAASAKKLGYALPPPPDMTDFSSRLRHQLSVTIPPGATRGMLLYRPGWDIAQPLSKDEYEERADVVLITRSGTTSMSGYRFRTQAIRRCFLRCYGSWRCRASS